MNHVLAAKLNADTQTAVIATSNGIKVVGYGDIKLSDLISMSDDDSAPCGYEAFSRFHNENPWVLPLLTKLAKGLYHRGVSRYSMRALFHKVRLDHLLETKSNEKFGLNNNYSPYYARLIMRLNPELTGFFKIKSLKEAKS
jgi:hypothetical protein